MEHPPLFALKLCSLKLLKLELNPSLIMSFPRNMALSRFVITLLEMLHRGHGNHQSGGYNFPTTTSQANVFSALWDKFCWRWMAPGCDGWAGAGQLLTHLCGVIRV